MGRPAAAGLLLLGMLLAGCTAREASAPAQPSATAGLAPSSTPTRYPTPTLPSWHTPAAGSRDFLPAPLYFLSSFEEEPDRGYCPLRHVVRLERDGRTRTLTSPCTISGGIQGFDVSPVDGSIVIAAFAGLWVDRHDGHGFQQVVRALPNPEEGATTGLGTGFYDVQSPAWSPDGTKIAYADGGIRILDLASGQRQDVIEDRCFVGPLDGGYAPCFYGDWYRAPRWSPDGRAILFRSQNADYFYQMIYRLGEETAVPIPGASGVAEDDIAWSRSGTHLLFDYFWPLSPGLAAIQPSFVRLDRDGLNAEVLWDHSSQADPVFASAGNNPWQVRHPFETADGRVLFFQAEPCETGSCYDYALMEGKFLGGSFETRVLHWDALPEGIYSLTWHESGEYAALILRGNPDVPWFLAVMKVDTGELYLLAEESRWAMPLQAVWGKQ
jgi:hypothetical protein